MSKASGLVAPGVTATMTLQFNAEGSELFRAPIRIDVSGRSSSNTTGKSFEIVGESVVPGKRFFFFFFFLFFFAFLLSLHMLTTLSFFLCNSSRN